MVPRMVTAMGTGHFCRRVRMLQCVDEQHPLPEDQRQQRGADGTANDLAVAYANHCVQYEVEHRRLFKPTRRVKAFGWKHPSFSSADSRDGACSTAAAGDARHGTPCA